MVTGSKVLDDYLSYLKVIKGRSENTIAEYRVDIRLLFLYIYRMRFNSIRFDCSFADIDFIKSISIDDVYSFVRYCQEERKCSIQTCGRKIIAIRQFWIYLKKKAHLIDENYMEELEVPKIPQRLPKYLSLDDSIRLLIQAESSVRNYCIVTLFLNCALRLSELASLNLSNIDTDKLTIIGKGDKQRIVYLNPAAKQAIDQWLSMRIEYKPQCDALFISKRDGTRLGNRGIQLVVKKLIINAGLNQNVSSPHKLRHSSATLLYRYGKVDLNSLREILGHVSLSTTQVYLHSDAQQLQAAINSNPLSSMINRSHVKP